MRLLSFFMALILSWGCLAQSRLDSLLPLVHTLPNDSTKVQAYLDIAWDYLRKDAQSALTYADSAGQLAQKLDLVSRWARANRTQSFALSSMGKYPEAEAKLQTALDIFTELKDSVMMVDTQVEFGWLKQTQSQLTEDMGYYMNVLPMAEKLHNKNNQARIHNYIGGIYRIQKQYDQAVINYRTAHNIEEELGFKPGISACLTNLAAVYKSMKDFDKALQYNKKALDLKYRLNDDLGAARVLNNIAVIYNEMERYDDAEKNFEAAEKLAKKVKNQNLLDIIDNGKMVAAFGKGQYRKTIQLAHGLTTGTDTVAAANLENSIKVYSILASAYEHLNNYKNAYLSTVKSQKLSEQLYNEKILLTTNDLDAKYQNQQKTKEIALLASEKNLQALQLNKRKNERNAIIAFAVLALLLAGLLYNQYRIKQKSNKELQELDKLKSNFFANVSHEFRTPLTLIKGSIEHLEQYPDEKLEREDIKMIRRNTNKVLQLVEQLLELSKIDQKKLQLESTEGDVYKCLRAATSSFNSHAAQRQMDYRVKIPKETLWTAYDRDKLEKVVYNLLSNAFKFNEDGGIVAFEASYENEELIIQVSDSGKGISEEKLPFIFDRFYQVDTGSTRESGGSGIGLSLSKDLVELMDGTITVSSEAGKGSFFKVQFPLERIKTRLPVSDDTSDREKTTPTKSFQLSRPDRRNVCEILLIEDNEDMRQFIKEQLLQEYRVLEAVNGKKDWKWPFQEFRISS